MLYHTDHWFMRPSEWRLIPVERQGKLCELMAGAGWRVGMQSDISILDSTRKRLIEDMKNSPDYPGAGNHLEQAVMREQKKLMLQSPWRPPAG
jgi:hypothetical protein